MWVKTVDSFRKNWLLISILVSVLLLIGFIVYIGVPFLGLPGVKSIQLASGVREHIQQNCRKDSQRYNWLDCSKLEIEPAHPTRGEFSAYCSDSWIIGAGVENSNREILWDNTIEINSSGDIRSEEYGSTYHPDNWDEPRQDPNIDDFENDKYITPSPCL